MAQQQTPGAARYGEPGGTRAALVIRDYLKAEEKGLKFTKPSSHSLHYSNKD